MYECMRMFSSICRWTDESNQELINSFIYLFIPYDKYFSNICNNA